MSYVTLGAEDPFKLFEGKLAELRQGKAEEAAGRRPVTPLVPINWWCWDHPGFKDCFPTAFRAAQADCEAQGMRDQASCIEPLANHYAQKSCPCSSGPPLSILAGITGNNWLVAGIVVFGAVAIFMPAKKAKAA